jgi:hypothetical protein
VVLAVPATSTTCNPEITAPLAAKDILFAAPYLRPVGAAGLTTSVPPLSIAARLAIPLARTSRVPPLTMVPDADPPAQRPASPQ